MTNKLLIVGWDGATWDYIDPLLGEGALPNLAALLGRAARATLRSTIPPYTNVAWPSLVTGLSPARTGVFDAARPRPRSYAFIPTSLTGYRGVPIWRWVNRFGLRAGVLNVPMTYPAAPLEGYMVTGFDSPRRSPRVAYPVDLLHRWAERGHPYRVLEEETDLMDHQNPHQRRWPLELFLRRWERLTEEQGELVAWLWEHYPVDLLFVVFSVTDSVNHRTRDPGAIRRAYAAADRALGRVLEAVGGETLICLVSDHGSIPAERYVALYRVLADGDWLRFRPEVASRFWRRLPGGVGQAMARGWEHLPGGVRRVLSWPVLRLNGRWVGGFENIDWARTRVFARSAMGPLYVNEVGRWPEGCVSPDEVAALEEEVRERLLALRDDEGLPLFGRVWAGGELYAGARSEDVPPDLVVEPARWSDHFITGTPVDPVVRPIPPGQEYGTHTPNGVLVLAGSGIKEGVTLDTAAIMDVVPTLLAAWGVPLPVGVDGRVMEEAFVAPVEVRWQEAGEEGRESGEEVGEEVMNRLRALGYLD